MPLADYQHWNEDAHWIWWEEEGKHAEEDAANAAEAWRDEDPDPDFYECQDAPTECMEAGNYDQVQGDIWACSTCGTRFREVSEGVMQPI